MCKERANHAPHRNAFFINQPEKNCADVTHLLVEAAVFGLADVRVRLATLLAARFAFTLLLLLLNHAGE